MTRLIIHPGKHLADELQALGLSANQLAKELGVPTNRITQIIRGRQAWGYGLAPGPLVRHRAGYLDEPAKELRTAAGGAGNGEALQKIPQHRGGAKTRDEVYP